MKEFQAQIHKVSRPLKLPKATVVAEEDAKSGFHGTVEKAWI